MLYKFTRKIPENVKIVSIAVVLVVTLFLLQGNIEFSLSDEGYLWYGTWRTSLGEIPLRDFRSYQPGRYYWGAGWSLLFGHGIMGLRASVAIFQVLGLACGLFTIRRLTRSWLALWSIGFLFLMWMHPQYKIFEHSLAMALVYVGTILVEKPTLRRHFGAGMLGGMMMCFGENHGFCGIVSLLGLISFIWYKIDRSDLFRRLVAWGVGISVGYTPMLFMFIFVPGFFTSFVQRILSLFQRESLNLTLPVPWPWKIQVVGGDLLEIVRAVSAGIFFVILPTFCVLVGAYLLWTKRDLKRHAPLLASFAAVMTYIHYTFSRADLSHLTFSMHPLLIGLLSLPLLYKHILPKKLLIGMFLVLFCLSTFSVASAIPYCRKLVAPKHDFVKITIHGDQLWLPTRQAKLIQTVLNIHAERILPDEGLVIAPYWPGFYPILQRKSPWWDTYITWSVSEDEQNRMISDLQTHRVNWVVLGDVALKGTYELRFRNTHPLVWRHIQENFEPVPVSGLPSKYQLLKRISP